MSLPLQSRFAIECRRLQWMFVVAALACLAPEAARSNTAAAQLLPTLTINSLSVAEGHSGATTAAFTVTLSPASTQIVTVDYATVSGTATAGSDFVAASGTLTFAPGVLTRPINVTINGDTAVEPNEVFIVTLNNPRNAVRGGPAVGTILNDDAGGDASPPIVSITAPAPGAIVSGAVSVSATASDNVGVTGVQFKLDGATFGIVDTTAPYAVSWNTQGAADLVFGVTKVAAAGGTTIAAGTGFTKRASLSCLTCGGDDFASEDTVKVVAGPAAATFTFGSAARYLAQMTAFKSAGTPAYVQSATLASNLAGGTIARTFSSAVTAGNLLVVAVAWQGNSAVSVTDNRANVYVVASSAHDGVSGLSLAILYAANATGGATTVTAGFGGGTPAVRRLAIHEYSGIATTSPVDAVATNIADGIAAADAVTSGSAATTVTPPTPGGPHTLRAEARDAAGNVATSTAVTVTVDNGGDTTPPVISGVTVSAITSSGATFAWTTNEPGDSEVEYGLTTAYGAFSLLDPARVTSHTMPVTGLAPNTLYHYRVRSRDAAGNLGLSGDFSFTTLGGTPPSVSITSPDAGTIVSGPTSIRARAIDDVGVAGVQFEVDGAPIGPEDTIFPYAAVWDPSSWPPGPTAVRAVARDVAGIRTTSAPVTVTVSHPTFDVTLAWDASTGGNATGYKMHFGTLSGTYSTHINVGNLTSYTVTGLQAGTVYYFAVTAYNAAGQESAFSNEISAGN